MSTDRQRLLDGYCGALIDIIQTSSPASSTASRLALSQPHLYVDMSMYIRTILPPRVRSSTEEPLGIPGFGPS